MSRFPSPPLGSHIPDYKTTANIDWSRYPSVGIECDDWGACQSVRSAAEAEALRPKLEKLYGKPPSFVAAMETPDDLQRLYRTLESVRGHDGQPIVMTAFICLGNPDYAAIEADRFETYHDIGIDQGLPAGWERGDLIGAWRDGVRRGLFAPEFHAGLHHVSPIRWLELLRSSGPLAEAARLLFKHCAYQTPEHLPEYDGMNARQQHLWVARGIERFERLFGYRPVAGVNSDTTWLTEAVWAANGLEIFSLRNARNHDGDMLVYYTKPWNAQDVYCPMGAYNSALNMISLARNVHLDGVNAGNWPHAADGLRNVIRACWKRNEPAIINSHRKNYVSFDPAQAESGRNILAQLLGTLAQEGKVYFLSTAEIGQLYRDGHSIRRIGNTRLVRQWSQPIRPLRLDGPISRITALPDGRELRFVQEGNHVTIDLPEGNYLVQ